MSKVVLSIRVDAELVSKLEEAATFLRTTRSQLVESVLADFIRRTIDEERARREEGS